MMKNMTDEDIIPEPERDTDKPLQSLLEMVVCLKSLVSVTKSKSSFTVVGETLET